MKLSKVLDAIKDELKKPLPEPRIITAKKRRKKMAKKAAPQVDDEEDEDLEDEEEQDEDEGDEDEEDEAPAPKSKSKSKAAKSAKGSKSAKPAKKAKSKSNGDDEGYVTLQALAEEAEIEPQSARVKLRDSDLEKPEGGRWRWKEGSKDLKAARKALGL